MSQGNGLKRCARCGQARPLDQFYNDRSRPDGKGLPCKPCRREIDAERYASNRERIIAERKAYRDANKERINLTLRVKRFGITRDEYYSIINRQDGQCANNLCAGAAEAIDHDHECHPIGEGCRECIRAILCFACNRALGHAKEDSARLRGLADYIDDWRLQKEWGLK